MRVLICGSRTFREADIIRHWLLGVKATGAEVTVIHGAAKGADSLGGFYANHLGFDVEEYPAQWDRDGKAAGPIRNQRMLDEGKPEVVWAFVDKPLTDSRGTGDMVRRARKAGVPVFVTQYVAPAGQQGWGLPASSPCREEIPCHNPPGPDGGICDTCKQRGCDQ
jgi:hypothetical protein